MKNFNIDISLDDITLGKTIREKLISENGNSIKVYTESNEDNTITLETFGLYEIEKEIKKLKQGKKSILYQSIESDKAIGKHIRKRLIIANGASIQISYDIITDEMQNIASTFQINT